MGVIEMWWLSLAIAAVVIVVVAILLGIVIAAAKRIDSHAANIWTVGKQIAGNTVTIWTLEKTNNHLQTIIKATGSLHDVADEMKKTLKR